MIEDWEHMTDSEEQEAIDRAMEMLRGRPPAVSGQGGHQQTLLNFYALRDMGIPRDVAVDCITSLETNQPQWTKEEVQKMANVVYGDRFGNVENFQAFGMPVSNKDVSWKETNPKDGVGIKKPRSYQSVSAIVHRLVGIGMMEGARKYGRHNYRVSKVRAGVYYDATKNHLDDWWEGEDIDKLSGLPHVIKAICSLYVLADAIVGDNLVDDRPPKLVDIEKFTAEYQKVVDDMFTRIPDSLPAYTQVSHPKLVKTSEEK